MQPQWIEKMMPYANLMCIIYKKGILNEVDHVSRRPDIHQNDNLCKPKLNFWWNGNVIDIIYNGNDPVLLELSTLESLNVDDNFLS